jgi:hypothetical protein
MYPVVDATNSATNRIIGLVASNWLGLLGWLGWLSACGRVSIGIQWATGNIMGILRMVILRSKC